MERPKTPTREELAREAEDQLIHGSAVYLTTALHQLELGTTEMVLVVARVLGTVAGNYYGPDDLEKLIESTGSLSLAFARQLQTGLIEGGLEFIPTKDPKA